MIRHSTAQPITAVASTSSVAERIALLAVIILALTLAFINLGSAPRTWFDEGSHLHVPKTLVQHGVYADISAEGFRYFGPTIGVGPTVMLPIALVYKLGGIGLLQGRLVIALYLLLALGAGYLLARRVHGTRVALLALLLLLASRTLNFEGMVEYGRQALGEVPGMAFLFLGLIAWHRAVTTTQQHRTTAVAAGVFFGLALITKNQFVLIITPSLALLALLDWFYYRAGSWWLRVAPLLIACAFFGGWTLFQLQFLGPAGFAANFAKTRQAAGGAIFVCDFLATRRAAWYLLQIYGGLLIPALLYGLWRCRMRTAAALAELPLILMPLAWSAWYLVSLGWPRYAFPAVALGALAVARMGFDLFALLNTRRPLLSRALAGYIALVIAIPLILTSRVVLTPDDSAHRMADYLETHVAHDVIIETWEPELGVLSDHRFKYPPTELLDPAVRNIWFGSPPPLYDGLDMQPPYVIVGSFGAWVAIYPDDRLKQEYDVIFTSGAYTLYRLRTL